MKKKTLFVSSILFLYLLFVSLIFSPQLKIVGSAVIDGMATFGSASIGVTLFNQVANLTVPATGNIIFNDTYLKVRLTSVSGLTEGWGVNASLYGQALPTSWTERTPNSTEVGSKKIEFFEININASTVGSSYNIYFNVTQAELGSLPANNVSLFTFNDTSQAWQNLTTIVVNGNTNPAQFYGVTTHFSKFLIGQKPAVSGEGSGSGSGSGSGQSGGSSGAGGSGGGGGGGAAIYAPRDLFDVQIQLESIELMEGDILKAAIELIRTRGKEKIDVQVKYSLLDIYKNEIFMQTETLAIEKELSYEKAFREIKLVEGDYILRVEILYGDRQRAFAEQKFKVLPTAIHLPGIFFDVGVVIPSEYRKVLPGKEVLGDINVTRIKGVDPVATIVEYTIEDRKENVFFTEIETKTIEKQIKYSKQITLPADISPGVYMFFVKVKYKNDTALAGYPFEVIEEKKALEKLAVRFLYYKQLLEAYSWYLISLLIIIIIILAITYFVRQRRYPHLDYLRNNKR